MTSSVIRLTEHTNEEVHFPGVWRKWLMEMKSSCTVPEHIMDELLIHNMLRLFAGLTPFLPASSCDDKCSRISEHVGPFLPLFHQGVSVRGVPGVTNSFLSKPALWQTTLPFTGIFRVPWHYCDLWRLQARSQKGTKRRQRLCDPLEPWPTALFDGSMRDKGSGVRSFIWSLVRPALQQRRGERELKLDVLFVPLLS